MLVKSLNLFMGSTKPIHGHRGRVDHVHLVALLQRCHTRIRLVHAAFDHPQQIRVLVDGRDYILERHAAQLPRRMTLVRQRDVSVVQESDLNCDRRHITSTKVVKE
jgi:hypothetical protein